MIARNKRTSRESPVRATHRTHPIRLQISNGRETADSIPLSSLVAKMAQHTRPPGGRPGETSVGPLPFDAWIAWSLAHGWVDLGVAQRARIVSLLSAGERVSGQAIASRLGISRAAVHKHVETLRTLAVPIESV